MACHNRQMASQQPLARRHQHRRERMRSL